jgi:TRL-like protein family
MKRFWLVFALGAACILVGCATMIPMGGIYTGTKMPFTATSNSGVSTKTGQAQCISILGLVAVGDCSIETAKKNGGITKVNTVDWDIKNILGIYGTYNVIVSGE